MSLKFRDLRADEIECRVGTVSKSGSGFSLLLYKDARCDQNILDETVGVLNWKRSHCRDNANCIVSIWDKEKKEWVSKEDTGTESFTEKEKGLASDSFKRACVNFGIGRKLYKSPFIWISEGDPKKDKFEVKEITYTDQAVDKLVIINSKTEKVVFSTKNKGNAKVPPKETTVDEQPIEEYQKALKGLLKMLQDRGDNFWEEVKVMYSVEKVEDLSYADIKEVGKIAKNKVFEHDK